MFIILSKFGGSISTSRPVKLSEIDSKDHRPILTPILSGIVTYVIKSEHLNCWLVATLIQPLVAPGPPHRSRNGSAPMTHWAAASRWWTETTWDWVRCCRARCRRRRVGGEVWSQGALGSWGAIRVKNRGCNGCSPLYVGILTDIGPCDDNYIYIYKSNCTLKYEYAMSLLNGDSLGEFRIDFLVR